MRLIICLVASASLFFTTTYAQTSPAPETIAPSHQWRRIADLPPGSPILIREIHARNSTPCALVWIDNVSLACDGVDGRVIYPATSVASVAPDNPPSQVPVGLIIATTAGAVLGGLEGSNGNAGSTAAGVFLGAGFFAGVAAMVSDQQPSPWRASRRASRVRMRPGRRMRRSCRAS